MHHLDKGSPYSRWVLFAVAATAIAATLATCKSVTDTVLAPREQATLTANCLEKCKHEGDDDDHDEDDRHNAIVSSCKGDAGCQQREAARHKDADDKNHKKHRKCDDDCHHQGGGKGGR